MAKLTDRQREALCQLAKLYEAAGGDGIRSWSTIDNRFGNALVQRGYALRSSIRAFGKHSYCITPAGATAIGRADLFAENDSAKPAVERENRWIHEDDLVPFIWQEMGFTDEEIRAHEQAEAALDSQKPEAQYLSIAEASALQDEIHARLKQEMADGLRNNAPEPEARDAEIEAARIENALYHVGDLVYSHGNSGGAIGVVTYVELSERNPYRVEFGNGVRWFHGQELYLADIAALDSRKPEDLADPDMLIDEPVNTKPLFVITQELVAKSEYEALKRENATLKNYGVSSLEQIEALKARVVELADRMMLSRQELERIPAPITDTRYATECINFAYSYLVEQDEPANTK